MKLIEFVKGIASILWLLMSVVFIAVGVDILSGDPSVSRNGSSTNFPFGVAFIFSGGLSILVSVLTFFMKRMALILSVPAAILTAVSVFGEMHQLIQGSMLSPKYLIAYGAMFLASALTTGVLLWPKKKEVEEHA